MSKKGLAAILSACMVTFYAAIIMYVFWGIFHVQGLRNFETALFFEIISFIFLMYVVLDSIICRAKNTIYVVPRVMYTIVYVIILDVLNVGFIAIMPHVYLVLLNLVLLFIYCLISIPMYIIGKR